MDNCWISCQVMGDMENFYDNLIIINLYDGRPMSDHVRWDYLKQFRQAKFDQV